MDICERLQKAIDSGLWNLVTGQSDTWTLDLLEDAKAEIVRLREHVADLEDRLDMELGTNDCD